VAEQVALVAQAKRESLLRRNRHRLRLEDLEECLSQATLELLASARAGGRFASSFHLANVLEQRFRSRVADRRRALAGRSPMQAAMEDAVVLGDPKHGEVEVADSRLGVEELVMLRLRLGRLPEIANQLSPEQRLVIACQVGLDMERAEFCRRFGWSPEKYRRMARCARAALRVCVEKQGQGHLGGVTEQAPAVRSRKSFSPTSPRQAGGSEQAIGTNL
jgi:DNA-directed RNA polymerase specialized sigma24 family protein